MADKKINELAAWTDGQTNDNTKVFPLAPDTTGTAGKATILQLKKAMSVFKAKYVATGSEGTTLTISALAAMEILMIAREGQTMYEVSATPDTAEFIWDTTNITLGLATHAGERFLILFKNA